MTATADRGGPFVRERQAARNWMSAAAPGIATRIRPDESSPIGGCGASRDASEATRCGCKPLALAHRGARHLRARELRHGLYIHAKAQVAQVLLHAAWERERARARR